MVNVTGLHQVVFAFRQHGEDMERGVQAELHTLAGMAARMMQRLVPKSRSTLWESIKPDQIDPMTWQIGPHTDYARYVEDGIKPGGRGLPLYMDPAAKSIIDWLQSKAPSRFMGPRPKVKKRVRSNTMAAVHANLELRDRYEGLALHVRKFGVKAQPFVEPTAREMEPVVLKRMNLAVRRVLAARPDAGGVLA